MDKVVNKTLALQNYTLSKGHCEGLAKSLGLLDDSIVNRILLTNNGIDGKEFAMVLSGLEHLHDFKSIIYKQNGFTTESMNSLCTFFTRKVPYHLEELKLIDLKLSPKCCEQLFSKLNEESYIKRLSLINVNQNDRQFDALLKYISSSKYLRELELNWLEVRQSTYSKLTDYLAENKQLTHLSLSWNYILELKQ